MKKINISYVLIGLVAVFGLGYILYTRKQKKEFQDLKDSFNTNTTKSTTTSPTPPKPIPILPTDIDPRTVSIKVKHGGGSGNDEGGYSETANPAIKLNEFARRNNYISD